MNLFDGQFKSRPKINLSGSSNTKSRDTLINEAIAERRKREKEKNQQISATKIQSLFRSYIIRKRLSDEFRVKFHTLFNSGTTHSDNEIKTLISYFVSFYSSNKDRDQADLQRFSQYVIKHKETIINILLRHRSNTEYALCRFLAIHLLLLNPRTVKSDISNSLSLRLIDFFTDPKSYLAAGYSVDQYEPTLSLILKFLINQGKTFRVRKFTVKIGRY